MKLARFEAGGKTQVGVVEGGTVRPAGDSIFAPEPGGDAVQLSEVRLLPPVAKPGKIICLGLNYRDHALETGQPIPTRPITFDKFPTSLVGHEGEITIPPGSGFVDYEAELAVVIGVGGRGIREQNATEHILGYTCMNDVSAREHQVAEGQWGRSKSFDTFGPMGPWIVTAEEIPDPHNLAISCRVNDEVVQSSRTSEMIFTIPWLISFISDVSTLEPGDVISTGTPPGVGQARTPPKGIEPGDTVVVAIEGIGELSNPVVAGSIR